MSACVQVLYEQDSSASFLLNSIIAETVVFVSHVLFVMSERKEQSVYIIFCEKLEKTRTETH